MKTLVNHRNRGTYADLAAAADSAPRRVPITPDDLAITLSTTPEIVHSLIGVHINRIDRRYVEMPSQSKCMWLRHMLGPVPERPLIALKDIAERTKVTIEWLRDACAKRRYPAKPIHIHNDKVLGELVTPVQACCLLKVAIESKPCPAKLMPKLQSFDRVSLLLWMCGLDADIKRKPVPYSDVLEMEIKRLSKLKDPERTIQALRLLSRYVDAKIVAESVLKNRFPWEAEGITMELEKMTGGVIEEQIE